MFFSAPEIVKILGKRKSSRSDLGLGPPPWLVAFNRRQPRWRNGNLILYVQTLLFKFAESIWHKKFSLFEPQHLLFCMASKKKAMPAIQRVKILGILLLVPVGLSAALVFILGLFSQGNLPFETTFFGGGGICLGSLLLFWWLCVSFARTKGAGSSGNSTTGGSSGCGSCGGSGCGGGGGGCGGGCGG